MARRMKEVYGRAIALVSSGAIDVRSIASDRRPLDDTPAAMVHAAQRTGIKTMVIP
jgi:L-iditol 2-dehydrogenase